MQSRESSVPPRAGSEGVESGSARLFLILLAGMIVLVAVLVITLFVRSTLREAESDRARERLRAHDERLRVLLDGIEDAIWHGDPLDQFTLEADHALAALDECAGLPVSGRRIPLAWRTAHVLRRSGHPARALALVERENALRFRSIPDESNFLDLHLPDPDEVAGGDSLDREHVRALLDLGFAESAACLAEDLLLEAEEYADEPEEDIDVLRARTLLAEARIACGLAAEAHVELTSALAAFGRESFTEARREAHLFAGRAAAASDQHAEALTHLRRALSLARKEDPSIEQPPAGPVALELAVELARGTRGREVDEAISLLERTLAGRRRDSCGDHAALAEHILALARALARNGDTRRAAERFDEALVMLRSLCDPRAALLETERAASVPALGGKGSGEDAAAPANRPSGDSKAEVVRLNDLGRALRAQGKLREAQPYYEQALAMKRRLVQGDDRGLATITNNVGLLAYDLGDAARGCQLLEEALAMRRRLAGGADDAHVAQSLINLALCSHDADDLERTFALEDEAVSILKRLARDDDGELAIAVHNRASTLFDLGRRAEAIAGHREALDMKRRLFTGDHLDLAQTLDQLGYELYRVGEYVEAEQHLSEALHVRRRLLASDHEALVTSLRRASWVHEATRDFASAEMELSEAIAMHSRLAPEELCEQIRLQLELADLLHAKGDRPGAHGTCLRVLSKLGKNPRACLEEALDVLRDTRKVCAHSVWFAEAEGPLLVVAEALLGSEGLSAEERRRVRSDLAEFYRAWCREAPDPARETRAREWESRR